MTIDASCMFPCGHIFHFACAESLIGAGTAQLPHAGATKCPHCRKAVSLHDLHLLDGGAFLYAVTAISVKAGACRWDALEGMERANMDKALEMWGVAANIRQCPIAHKYLGDVFFQGHGVVADPSTGLAWTTKAAELGLAESQVALGKRYAEGACVEANTNKALGWFLKAAVNGDREGQFHVGISYINGTGTTRDSAAGFTWLLRAAGQGSELAALHAARAYYRGGGIERNNKDAFKWFLFAAEHGVYDAQITVGIMYFLGEGVDEQCTLEDRYEATYSWFRKASEQGPHGQYLLAMAHMCNCGVTASYAASLSLLRKAAAYGHPGACYEIAVAYSFGYGVDVDEASSEKWAKMAKWLGYFEPLAFAGVEPEAQAGFIVVRSLTTTTLGAWVGWFRHARAHCKFADCKLATPPGSALWDGYMAGGSY